MNIFTLIKSAILCKALLRSEDSYKIFNDNYFGSSIETVYDKIFMITWSSQAPFLFDNIVNPSTFLIIFGIGYSFFRDYQLTN